MRFILLTLFAFMIAAPASASSCYRAQEVEAENGIRIHSELMVIGLNCQHMTPAGYKNFYAQYREFSARHGDLFATYEDVLMRHFKKNGKGSAEKQLNTMRTEFANKISQDSAKLRPDVFCSQYALRIPKAAGMSRDEVRQWAATVYPGTQISQPLCAAQ